MTSNLLFLDRKKATSPIPVSQSQTTATQQQQASTPEQIQQTPPSNTPPQITQPIPNTSNKDAWPSLQTGNARTDQRLTNGNRPNPQKPDTQPSHNRAPGNHKARTKTDTENG